MPSEARITSTRMPSWRWMAWCSSATTPPWPNQHQCTSLGCAPRMHAPCRSTVCSRRQRACERASLRPWCCACGWRCKPLAMRDARRPFLVPSVVVFFKSSPVIACGPGSERLLWTALPLNALYLPLGPCHRPKCNKPSRGWRRLSGQGLVAGKPVDGAAPARADGKQGLVGMQQYKAGRFGHVGELWRDGQIGVHASIVTGPPEGGHGGRAVCLSGRSDGC